MLQNFFIGLALGKPFARSAYGLGLWGAYGQSVYGLISLWSAYRQSAYGLASQ